MLQYLKQNINITSLSGYKTKAISRYYFEINTESDIQNIMEIYRFASDNNLKSLILGAGTNCLFAFDEFDGILIKNNLKGFEIIGNKVKIFSGEDISSVSEILKEKYNIDNLYPWIGLPGTFGGAVFGNAGCFGLRAEDIFLEGEVYNVETGKIEIVDRKWMNFSYRTSILKQNRKYFLINAILDIGHKINTISFEDVKNFRETKQPNGNSCGSVFINIPFEQAAGKLIQDSGLKGFRIGGAHVSELHANFILADENTVFSDVLGIIDYIKKVVFTQYKVSLQEEINIIYS